MKIYLDDTRQPPDANWVLMRWPDEVIQQLQTGQVTHLSLDHDLGDDQRGDGYDVLLWIEEAVALRDFQPPQIFLHTQNSAAEPRMQAALDSIQRLMRRREQPVDTRCGH